MKRNNKKGFTIVELVIVIAVIGILAAVLFPTFSGIITKANDNARLQNARNAYTKALTETPTAEYDYVCDGSYHYDVDNGFASSAHGDHAEGDKVLSTAPAATNP